MSAIVSVLCTSFAAMAKISLISMVGYILSQHPVKDPLLTMQSLRYLSRLANMVFLPSLIITSLGSSLSVALLGRIGILILYCFIINILSYGIAHTVGRYLHERNTDGLLDTLFYASAVAIGSPNAVSLPIMVMQTLCEDGRVNGEFTNGSSECFDEATSMLFVYSIGWHLMFWSYGFPLLKSLSKSSVDEIPAIATQPTEASEQDWKQYLISITVGRLSWDWFNTIFLSPSMIAIYLGLGIGLTPALQQGLFHSSSSDDLFKGTLRPFGLAILTLGEPLICVNCLVMAASLAHTDLHLSSSLNFARSKIDHFLFEEVDRKNSCKKDSLVEFVSLEHLEGISSSSNSRTSITEVPQFRTVATHILCRLLLAPLLMLPIVLLSIQIGVLPTRDRMMQLIILIESASPSAQIIIVCMNQLGDPKLAANIAYIYVIEYFFSILTITLWTTVAIGVFYS